MTEQLTHTRREKRASKRHKEGWELGWLLAEEEPLFLGGTVSPYIWTFKLQTFKDANVHLHVQWCQAWVKLQLALHLLLLMILHPLSVGFSRQEHWSGLSCPPPGDLPNPGIEPRSPAFQANSLPSEPPGKPTYKWYHIFVFLCLTSLSIIISRKNVIVKVLFRMLYDIKNGIVFLSHILFHKPY